jgi:hypothetical protein
MLPSMVRRLSISPELDWLGLSAPTVAPLPRTGAGSGRTILVSSMRNEGSTILEWVAHHRLLGFDTILIYSNGNTDGSDALLDALNASGIIHAISSEIADPAVSPQFKAFRHAFWFSELFAAHDWAAVLDADEFLFPLTGGAVAPIGPWCQSLADDLGGSGIALSWLWFPGDGTPAATPGLLLERFRTALPAEHVKSVFRIDEARAISVHTPALHAGRTMLDGNGEPRPGATASKSPFAGRLGHVAHYFNRSFAEWYLKRERGRGASRRDLRELVLFFRWWAPSRPAAHPTDAHIAAVKAEMARLLLLPGVAEAQTLVEARQAERLADPAIAVAFDETRRAFEAWVAAGRPA